MARGTASARSVLSGVTNTGICSSSHPRLAPRSMPRPWTPRGSLQRSLAMLPLLGERTLGARVLQSLASAQLSSMPRRATTVSPQHRALSSSSFLWGSDETHAPLQGASSWVLGVDRF